MIRYFTLVSVLYFIVGCTSPQKEYRKTYVDSNVVVNDTFYIRREVRNDTIAEAVFIDSNKASRFYDDILRFDETDTANIKHYTDLIHQKNIKLTEFDTYGLASVWVPVYQYRSKYCLYKPSDSGNRATKYITPSLLMLYSFDGYSPIAISAFNRLSDNVFNIKLKHIAEDESLPDEVNIYIIDPKTKLAVWEYKRGLYSEYDLAVPAAYLRQYPIVVIKSDMGKRVEYDFAAVNFKKLIAGAKK